MQDIGGKRYRIIYARVEELPPDQHWAFVDGGDTIWFVVREQHTALELEEAWMAFRRMTEPELATV